MVPSSPWADADAEEEEEEEEEEEGGGAAVYQEARPSPTRGSVARQGPARRPLHTPAPGPRCGCNCHPGSGSGEKGPHSGPRLPAAAAAAASTWWSL